MTTAVALPALTAGDELRRLAPGWDLDDLLRWPPDTFALTASVLADSGAYRCVVSPPAGCVWPPAEPAAELDGPLRLDAGAWAASAAGVSDGAPDSVRHLAASLDLAAPLGELDRPERWADLVGLLRLHAFADEACSGVGTAGETEFQRRAASLLAGSGSLSRLPADRLRVLPKLRPPASGMTLRSLSHHLAFDRSEVSTRWVVAPAVPPSRARTDKLTILLLPHPAAVRARDFVPVPGPLGNLDESRYGFYEYAPRERLDLDATARLIERARRAVGDVDVLVMPEGALDESEVADVQRTVSEMGVPYLITGVRQAPAAGAALGGNYAYFGARDWQAPPQHKHHRWCLDTGQVHQYHLGATLDPDRRWWEAIGLPQRCLTFVTVFDRITICPLVCEDLARPDPVTDVVRSVAPTLVVGLLLDGPQLAARWPARYASVLADDPGCSVLTLTALGMTQRSQPPGHPPSRAIALWKDPRRGLQEILMAEDAQAVALTAHARSVQAQTADGRLGKPVTELVLSGIEQVP